MTPSECAADSLVRAYLHGRALPAGLRRDITLLAETRLVSGKTPVLSECLRAEIDSQAIAPAGYVPAPAQKTGRMTVCIVPAASFWKRATPRP